MKDDFGMYVPEMEHDACGIGFIAHKKAKPSNSIITRALTMLENMEHRGGQSVDEKSGDGAGILFQIPHNYFKKKIVQLGIELPEKGKYGVGMVFFPSDKYKRQQCRNILNDYINKVGLTLLGYRNVPIDNSTLGDAALSTEPNLVQVFVEAREDIDEQALERKLFVLRKASHHRILEEVNLQPGEYYVTTFSAQVIGYKGQFTTPQLKEYYEDLKDENIEAGFAMVHSRFSTNTFPQWKLAQPFRYIAHNGEINTIKGNTNWMKSYQNLIESSKFTKVELEMIKPIVNPSNSDSANLDNAVELLVLGGRPLSHVMMMLIPEAWQNDDRMDDEKKAFYQYHASIMEPWDGPASLCFTDGKSIGATLDRNGLRPSRYMITTDDHVIMASEAGTIKIDDKDVIRRGRLQAGKLFLVDFEKGEVLDDEQIKADIINKKPYRDWLNANEKHIDNLKQQHEALIFIPENELKYRQLANGFTREVIDRILKPMCVNGKEAIGSMGSDIPLAVLSDKNPHLSHYFKQLFAQVSNPPIDPIRERSVMALNTALGKNYNILSESPRHCKQISMEQPVLTNEELERIKAVSPRDFRPQILDITFDNNGDPDALKKALDRICKETDEAILDDESNILILSDRNADKNKAAIPSLLALGTIHHHLIRNQHRVRVGIVIEAADIFETHHFATLIGYGATAINPYMAFASIKHLELDEEIDFITRRDNFIKSINDGLLKIFAKMGISTLQSYQGAQIFEIIGLSKEVVETSFNGTTSRIGGLDYRDIEREVLAKHNYAYSPKTKFKLPLGGVFSWRKSGERHLFTPEVISNLQKSSASNDFSLYKKYASLINDQNISGSITLRSLLEFKNRRPIELEDVESVETIMKRFVTGAMSFGSISWEAHTTLAKAMNVIGGKSNSGEGGEDPSRYVTEEGEISSRSATKQIASGRFGVSIEYLNQADELQIKIAQGAKPGEGGHLPGHKVDDWIAKTRNSTKGVGLISPPPHHDIYSIEDLAQLIYDLRNANPKARINVKLVSETGVGTVAAGVAKAQAGAILVSGFDGGTGAAPLSSIYHAGLPWEMGLSETHQTLMKNQLRSRIVLQTDGQIRTGKDLAIATLLGAEEWGIATAALVVEGCVMQRKCHNNTCSVGIATQRPELRQMFAGKVEHLVNFFRFLAEDMREHMAMLGFKTVDEMVGRADVLMQREEITNWKQQKIDLSPLLVALPKKDGFIENKDLSIHNIDRDIWKDIEADVMNNKEVNYNTEVVNINRSTGTFISHKLYENFGKEGSNTAINLHFNGSIGQSFGAFAIKGLNLYLKGEANDYVGKGLSGAKLIIKPFSHNDNEDEVVIGNVGFYGAINGEAYIAGAAGERFAVRNSGANIVVEGVGAHGCEYMTGGKVIILGKTGRNFAAGMTGGIAYIYDKYDKLERRYNPSDVALESLTDDDKLYIKQEIEIHSKLTESPKSISFLNNFNKQIKFMKKVMPFEYKRVLEEQELLKESM